MNKAVFFDKDGTLVEDVPYNANPERIELCPGVPEALRLLQQERFKIAVVSNQAGIAYGYFNETDLEEIKNSLQYRLEKYGVHLSGFYYCPHHINGVISRYAIRCNCRKPAPGLLFRAAADLSVDLSRSWMVGDILHDVESGNRAGCRTALINNGNETEWISSELRTPTFTAENITEAVKRIITQKASV